MATIDVTNAEHRDALRWACKAMQGGGAGWVNVAADGNEGPERDAARALSSPSQSATIVRALLGRCGVPVVGPREPCRSDAGYVAERVVDFGVAIEGVHVMWPGAKTAVLIADVPAFVLALLDATDLESAQVALREAGNGEV